MSIVRWSDPAIVDLEEIDDYWAAYSEDVAEQIAMKIERAAEFLISAPAAGPVVPRTAARKWNVATTPYLLVYRILDEGIEVLRVHHGRQNWGRD